MSSSQLEMVHEQRPVMSAVLFKAAMKGNKDVLIQFLRLLKEQKEVKVTIEADQHDLQDVIGSVTHFGDTLLHLFVTKMHNELALMVFKRDRFLMKDRNKKSETPLHCAAKVGNVDFIRALIEFAGPDVVKDAVRETDNNGDTTLHVAAKYGHGGVARELMKLDPGAAYMVNMEESFPLYIATVGGYTSMVKTMLEDDPLLACQQYSNGMFPVHVAAGGGKIELVKHFLEEYPYDAQLLDQCGRNLYHIAAEKNEVELFEVFHIAEEKDYCTIRGSLIDAKDYEGNTPLHIATIKGHTSVMIAISKLLTSGRSKLRNYQGLTPFELWWNQIRKTATEDMQRRLQWYIDDNGSRFTEDLFDRVILFQPDKNKWDRIQVIGLGSVLITTVAFAAAFTIPGGYNQDNGRPILGRKYMFKAFILANTQSFIQAFTSIFTLISVALFEPDVAALHHATNTFNSAAGCMVLAFGLGSYVMLAPINLPIAIMVLVSTLQQGSPFLSTTIQSAKFIFLSFLNFIFTFFKIGRIERTVGFGLNKRIVFRTVITLLYIFLLALA